MSEEGRAELTSWKEIADYLGVNVRTAQKWEQERQLPVRRLPGAKGRVSADPDEIDRWKREALVKAAWWANLTFLRWYAAVVTAVLLAGSGFALGWYLVLHSKGPPALFRVEFNTLVVTDSEGREVWRHTFDHAMETSWYAGKEGHLRIWFGDLEGDARQETLFVYWPADNEVVGTALYCFSNKGAVKWKFTPGAQVSDATQTYSQTYLIAAFQVTDLGLGRGRSVLVTSRHATYHPTQFALVDRSGMKTGEYWHSGHLDYMTTSDLDGDGVPEILLAGVNNGYRAATLVVLDPHQVRGASFQGQDSPYQIRGYGPAAEKAVVLFPRTCINRIFEWYNMGRQISVTDGIIHLAVYERLDGDYVVLYSIDRTFRVVRVEVNDKFKALHRDLEVSGKLSHSLTAGEVEALRDVRVLKGL